MSHRRLLSRTRRATTRGVIVWAQLAAASIAAVAVGCSGDGSVPGAESVRKVEAELSLAERMARYTQIRDAAAGRGIDHTGFLLAGIAYAETGLAHCWSEATWACQGPNSADCGGGPVIAGAADGPCSAQQGGLGMFQFDAGTFTDTLAKYGADVLTVAGNTSHALDYAINMVKISTYTTNAETDAKALQWIVDFDINNGTLRDQWIKTVTHYYNGCKPSYSCWSQRYAHYNDSLQTVIDETGLPFWVVAPPDKAPSGYLDHAGCDNIRGWAQDSDTPAQTIDVHLYFDSVPGDANAKTLVVKADRTRDDLCAPLGSCNHAWEIQVPRALMDGTQHTVHAYGINTNGAGSNPELTQSPATLQCDAPAAPVDAAHGVLRHVTNGESFGAWKFSAFLDVAHVTDAVLQSYTKGADWPALPQLAQGDDGSPEVWSIDGSSKRHVQSMDVLNAWRFDTAAIEKWPITKLNGFEQGIPWSSVPFLVQGSGPEVYVLDTSESAGAGGSAAGSGGSKTDGGVDITPPDGGAGHAGQASRGAWTQTSDDGSCSMTGASRRGAWGWMAMAGLAALAMTRRKVRRLGTS